MPPPARPEPTSYTRQLVASLSQLDPSRGAITKEQADQWKQALQTLAQQGVAAVPAIREFLEQNLELNYDGINGDQLLGQSSLRTALLDTLRQIGGPEALDVMLQTLRTTALPSEVVLAAKYLDQLAPGQYRQDTLNTVREILAMSSKGELAGWDVGPLFQVLQTYGDTTSVSTLEQLQSQWKYYATISLAGLQGGEGVQVLIRCGWDSRAPGLELRAGTDYSQSMPIYEFHCGKCERDSEVLVRSSDWKGAKCPHCGSTKLSKKFSVFASAAAGGGTSAAPACTSNPSSCGMCGTGRPHRH